MTLGIDVGTLEQKIDAAHQIPDHPLHQTVARKQKLIAERIASVVALARTTAGIATARPHTVDP